MKFSTWFLLFCGLMHQESQISFRLQMVSTEKSKDSNSTSELWQFNKKQLTFSKTYGGKLGSRKPNKMSKILTEEQLNVIESIIIEHHLEKNVDIPKISEFQTPYSAVDIVWELEKDGKHYRMQIYDLARQINQDEDYQNINTLLTTLKKYMIK